MLLQIWNTNHPKMRYSKKYSSCDSAPETIGFIKVLHFRNVPKNLPFRLQIERLCTVVYCVVMLSSVILFYTIKGSGTESK
jgi:hypothetical protein